MRQGPIVPAVRVALCLRSRPATAAGPGEGLAGGDDLRDCAAEGFGGALACASLGALILPTLALDLWGKTNNHDGSGRVAAFGIVSGALASVAIAKSLPTGRQLDAFGAGLLVLLGLLSDGGYLTTGPISPRRRVVWSW